MGLKMHWVFSLKKANTFTLPAKKESYEYDTKLQVMVRLQFWRSEEYGADFIQITPRSTLNMSGNTCLGSINGSK